MLRQNTPPLNSHSRYPSAATGPAVPATADPSRAPDLLVGTADCGSDGTFDFLGTQSNSESNIGTPRSSPAATAPPGSSSRSAST